jgi:hypothetical protein
MKFFLNSQITERNLSFPKFFLFFYIFSVFPITLNPHRSTKGVWKKSSLTILEVIPFLTE